MNPSYKILYVEDHSSIRDIAKLTLELTGLFDVDITYDPRAAVKLVAERAYDAVLMDLRLPDMHAKARPDQMMGVWAIKEIRQFSDVPIMVVSAYSDAKTKRQAHEAGATMFKSKPVEWRDFAPKLVDLIKRKAKAADMLPAYFGDIQSIGKAPLVFCSYSDDDAAHLLKLDSYLHPLERQGLLELWSSQDIPPGADRAEELWGNLEQADLILLMASPDYLASDACFEQYRYAVKNSTAVVVPIIVRACDWRNSLFGGLPLLPVSARPVTSWGNHDEAWLQVVEGVRFIVKRIKGGDNE